MSKTYQDFINMTFVLSYNGYSSKFNETTGDYLFYSDNGNECIAIYDSGDYDLMCEKLREEFDFIFEEEKE